MITYLQRKFFAPGVIKCSTRLIPLASAEEIRSGIASHTEARWSQLTAAEVFTNVEAVEHSKLVFSRHRTAAGTHFLIVTLADRSVTFIGLPDEFE